MQLGVSPSKAAKYNNPVKQTHDYYKAEIKASISKYSNESKAELIP
jgi:hypothetical protein